MPQTVNGQNTSEKDSKPAPRVYRPGQRQQERMQRLARRKKRNRIIWSSIAACLIIAAGIAAAIWFQNYNAQQALIASNKQATATAHADATALAHTHATATAVTEDCFLTPGAPTMPAIYEGSATPTAGPDSAPAISGTPVTLKDGLKYVDIKAGTGATVKEGDQVTANYTGWLVAGCKKFNSNFDQTGSSAGPVPFTIQGGQNGVIQGWVEGLPGMKVGGIRRIFIPAKLGYGAQGVTDQNGNQIIPPNADLVFDVQLVSVK